MMKAWQTAIGYLIALVSGWWWGERPDAVRAVNWVELLTAAGTFAAVGAALYISSRDAAWRRADRLGTSNVIRQALIPEMRRLQARLSELIGLIALHETHALDCEASNRPNRLGPRVVDMLISACKPLDTPVSQEFSGQFHLLAEGLGEDAAYVLGEMPRVRDWLELGVSAIRPDTPISLSMFSVAADVMAEIGLRTQRLTKISNAVFQWRIDANIAARNLSDG